MGNVGLNTKYYKLQNTRNSFKTKILIHQVFSRWL